MHHFVVKYSKFSSPQAARGLWPPNPNPADVPEGHAYWNPALSILTVLSVFSGQLLLLAFNRFFASISFSVVALSIQIQLSELFVTFFRTQSVHLSFFPRRRIHLFKQFSVSPDDKLFETRTSENIIQYLWYFIQRAVKRIWRIILSHVSWMKDFLRSQAVICSVHCGSGNMVQNKDVISTDQ